MKGPCVYPGVIYPIWNTALIYLYMLSSVQVVKKSLFFYYIYFYSFIELIARKLFDSIWKIDNFIECQEKTVKSRSINIFSYKIFNSKNALT